jgi:CheY-like chemotaxis protein
MGAVVLVAEDEHLLAMLLGDLLEDEGFEVILAADGVEALERIGARRVDVLLTDLDMPRLGGWELIRQLRTDRPCLPVVVMTGRLPPDSVCAGAVGGEAPSQAPFALLIKPFAPDHLIGTLRRVLAASGADGGGGPGMQADRAPLARVW